MDWTMYIAHLAEAQTNVKATKKNGSVCKKEKMYEMWVYVVLYGLYSYVFHCLLVQRVTSTDQGSMWQSDTEMLARSHQMLLSIW